MLQEEKRKMDPIIEDGVIAGNFYDKYGTKNPVARYLVNNFHLSLDRLVAETGAEEIHEVGCGEGNLSIPWARQKKTVRSSDFSHQVIEKAKENADRNKVDISFKAVSIYELDPEHDAAELIVCCEVLEHLETPGEALDILVQLASPYLIVSVPREPLWRILNVVRGKYVKSFGNTPGHIQHWSKQTFLKQLSSRLDLIRVTTPFPWIMALCRSKKA
jgi:2-polyprenyl-3-methyl-5-hydroxy-6-metoxy-1,4-benzoquinol methylase